MSILTFIWLLLTLMPKGFDMNHEQIGTGKPALVFVYDTNLSVSIEQSAQMNKARDQLDEQVLFIIAKIGTREGDLLIAKYRAESAELLLFDPSGSLVKRQFALLQSSELIQWLAVGVP
jgi:hypothetical protein